MAKAIILAWLALLVHTNSHCQSAGDLACVEKTYLSQVGVREATGRNDGKAVAQYLRTCGLGTGYSWCAAFVNYCLTSCDFKTNNNAWAAAWFPDQKIIWTPTKPIGQPRTGDCVGFRFGKSQRISHIGFVHEWGRKSVVTVEGNTNMAGSREGDGVYCRRRPIGVIAAVSRWTGGVR
ncbi:CHAP domain-containing protein [Flexibacter flexilis DSM 6793]|uniref:CHAP domain-containing protein n=1 Tax=Flexibacter flexilis DSM 6793 TaxID=927664 RepID=A0A1I1DZ52_9BACT|nr:CHAP domain-containing protein [Flexibacter flexilis]SFB80339.1 CHAP domain-containing protein [Flexibacter flexilis DSM 6793]